MVAADVPQPHSPKGFGTEEAVYLLPFSALVSGIRSVALERALGHLPFWTPPVLAAAPLGDQWRGTGTWASKCGASFGVKALLVVQRREARAVVLSEPTPGSGVAVRGLHR